MNDADDVPLQLKKKARRRLVGAIAFAALAALALPLVMTSEPPMPEQEVEIRIPDPNTAPPLPPPASVTPAVPLAPPEPAAPEVASPAPPAAPPANPETRVINPPPPAPPASKPAVVAAPVPASNPAAEAEARRAADILSGKSPGATAVASAAGVSAEAPHVVLIGAFSNTANVENLKKKLQELKIPVYTEALDSPQGAKTRVRAGAFRNRAAADAALVKMQRIGVCVSGCKVVPQS
jgi:DedD protein